MKMEISTSVPWLLVLLALASSLATICGWVLSRVSGRQSAAFRHFLWWVALAVPLAAMPVAWKHPRIIFHVRRFPQPEAKPSEHLPSAINPSGLTPIEPKEAASAPMEGGGSKSVQPRVEMPRIAIPVNCWWAAWSTGVVLCMVPLLRSHRKARQLMARDCDPACEELMRRLDTAQRRLGASKRVRLLVSNQDGIPFSYGILRPTIVMPQSSGQWEEEKVDLCLTHELAHLLRGDLWALFVAQVATLLCWFNPLVWIAAGKLREEAERATDDLVLSRKIRPETYAASLVSIAEEYHGSYLAIALPMAQPNRLKQRVHAILDSSVSRSAPRFSTKLAMSLLALGGLVAAVSVQIAAAATPPLETFKAFMAQRQAALSKLDTFQMEGTLAVTLSDAYMKFENSGEALALRKKQRGEDPRKVTHWRYRIWGKGDRIKEVLERLDESGKVSKTDTYYLTAHTITWVQQSPGKPESASSHPLDLGPNYGLLNECPAFLELAFLHRSIVYSGIPALLPSHLSKPDKWETALQSLQPQGSQDGSLTRVKITGTTTVVKGMKRSGTTMVDDSHESEGCSLVDLANDPNGQPQVKSITFMEKVNDQEYISRKVDVVEYFHDPSIGDVGKKFQVGVAYGMDSEKGPGVTWDFDIQSIRINVPVAESEVAYEGYSGFYDGNDPTRRDHVNKAVKILDELRELDAATDQWANKNKKRPGDRMSPADLLPFVPQGTLLYDALNDPAGPKDLLGNPLGPLVVDAIPKVDPATRRTLSDAVDDAFWRPFIAK